MSKRIVCAANRYNKMNSKFGETFLYVGARHWDGVMRMQHENCDVFLDRESEVQGFIDQYGNFHNRQQAWRIAEAAGQIVCRVGGDTADGGTLYSENLY